MEGEGALFSDLGLKIYTGRGEGLECGSLRVIDTDIVYI